MITQGNNVKDSSISPNVFDGLLDVLREYLNTVDLGFHDRRLNLDSEN